MRGQEKTSHTLKPSNNLTNHHHNPPYFRLTNQQCLPPLQLRIPPAILDALHRLQSVCTDLPCLAQDNPVLCSLMATISLSSLRNGISNAKTLASQKLSAAPASQTIAPSKSKRPSNFSLVTSLWTGPHFNLMSRSFTGHRINRRTPWRPLTN